MKLLCTTDFSNVSINAINWVFRMLQVTNGGEIEITHCLDSLRRADMFASIDDILLEKAKRDMKSLETKYMNVFDNITVSSSIHKANTKTFIPSYAAKHKFDLIVTGTTGLTSLKDIMVGSVTDYISKHTKIPLLTIPPDSTFTALDTVVLGIGKEEINQISNLNILHEFLAPHNPKVHLTQVLKKDRHTIAVDLRIEDYLKDLNFEYTIIEKEKSITNSLNKLSNSLNANLLCMIHYKRNWIEKLVHTSITKEELYNIHCPLLIISD